MKHILITGSNGGIGCALVRKYLSSNCIVYAVYNSSNDDLCKLSQKNLVLIKADLNKETDILNLSNFLQKTPITMIINAVGIRGPEDQTLCGVSSENWKKVMYINAISIMILMKYIILHGNIKDLKTIINISSDVASLKLNLTEGDYLYKASKAASNSILKTMSVEFKKKYNINTVMVHPGWVKTSMNINYGKLSPEQCAMNLAILFNDISSEHNGKYLNYDGTELPW